VRKSRELCEALHKLRARLSEPPILDAETYTEKLHKLFGLVYSDETLKRESKFRKEEHPRGQPDNAGQFVEKSAQETQEQEKPEGNDDATAASNDANKPLPAGNERSTGQAEKLPEDIYKSYKEFTDDIENKFGTAGNKIEVSKNIQNENLNRPAITQSIKGIENIANTFPALKNNLTRIDVAYGNDILMETSFEGVLYFKNKSYKSYEDAMRASVDSRTVSGRISSGKERLESAGCHEAAHLIVRELIYKNKAYKDDKERRNAWNLHTEATAVIDEAFNRLGIKKDTEKDKLILEISLYAKENDSECVAEAVTDYYNNAGQAKSLSRMIYKVIQERLGG
jgi:hypothetical protein